MSASAVDELRAAFDEPFRTLGQNATRDRETVVSSWPTLPIELIHALVEPYVSGRSRAVVSSPLGRAAGAWQVEAVLEYAARSVAA